MYAAAGELREIDRAAVHELEPLVRRDVLRAPVAHGPATRSSSRGPCTRKREAMRLGERAAVHRAEVVGDRDGVARAGGQRLRGSQTDRDRVAPLEPPATAGSTRRIVVGSTLRSSDPATGRSNVTVISAVGMASPVGVVRVTRSGEGLCACA